MQKNESMPAAEASLSAIYLSAGKCPFTSWTHFIILISIERGAMVIFILQKLRCAELMTLAVRRLPMKFHSGNKGHECHEHWPSPCRRWSDWPRRSWTHLRLDNDAKLVGMNCIAGRYPDRATSACRASAGGASSNSILTRLESAERVPRLSLVGRAPTLAVERMP